MSLLCQANLVLTWRLDTPLMRTNLSLSLSSLHSLLLLTPTPSTSFDNVAISLMAPISNIMGLPPADCSAFNDPLLLKARQTDVETRERCGKVAGNNNSGKTKAVVKQLPRISLVLMWISARSRAKPHRIHWGITCRFQPVAISSL